MTALCLFLRTLHEHPPGQAMAEAIALGALRPMGGCAVTVHLVLEPDVATLVGSFGLLEPEISKSAYLSLRLPLPTPQAIATGQTFTGTGRDLMERFPLLGMDRPWSMPLVPRLEDQHFFVAPMLRNCVPYGAIFTAMDEPFPRGPEDWAYARAIQDICSLWGTHEIDAHTTRNNPSLGAGTILTDRQLRVIELLAQGRTNESIAHALGYSLSTIKADLRLLYDLLGDTNRLEVVARAKQLGLLPHAPGELGAED